MINAPFAESSLLRASWEGAAAPPTPPLIFRMFAEITAKGANHHFFDHHHPLLNHHFFEHHGGGLPPPPTPLLICRMLTELSAPLVESSLPRTSWGGLPPPPNPPADLMLRLRQTLHRTLRKCCASTKLVPVAKVLRLRTAESVPDLAKVLRLLRNLYLTFLTHPADL